MSGNAMTKFMNNQTQHQHQLNFKFSDQNWNE